MERGTWSKDEYKVLAKQMESGMKTVDIARLLNRSYATTYTRCLKYTSEKDAARREKQVTKIKQRVCLRCSNKFKSLGPGNRVCHTCHRINCGYAGVVYS